MRTLLKKSARSKKLSELKPTKTIQDELKLLNELKKEDLTPSEFMHEVSKQLCTY